MPIPSSKPIRAFAAIFIRRLALAAVPISRMALAAVPISRMALAAVQALESPIAFTVLRAIETETVGCIWRSRRTQE